MITYRFLLAATAASYAAAQLLNNTYIPFPGLSVSSTCSDALNTSVSCPYWLSAVAETNNILNSDLASALCQDSCFYSLASARNTIAQGCSLSTDIMVVGDVAYPATFIIDQYILAYNTSCTKDSTGAFCDPQILSWQAYGGMNATQACSDCWLQSQRNALNGPLGYDPDVAARYASLTSACNATSGYAVTTPSTYAYNATATTEPATSTFIPPPQCTGGYTVQSQDSCNSVALSLGVSTYNLLQYNGLDLYCVDFNSSVGSTLCQPPQCSLYTWQAVDTCASVVSQYPGMTIPQFLAWNPNFNQLCQNTLSFVGYQVCLSNPGGALPVVTATMTAAPGGGVATTAQPAPTNSVNGTTTNCGGWYTVQSGDTCGKVSVAAGISLSDFYFLNPEINSDCTNLWLGNAYCVQAVGDITTYPGYTQTSTALITVTSATFSSANTGIPSSTSSPGYAATIAASLPTASGTIQGCATYRDYDANGINGCNDVANLYLVSLAQLQSWNPSLTGDINSCIFQSGYSYCVVQQAGVPVTPVNYCLNVNATMPNTISSCSCFTTVQGYLQGSYGCSNIANDFSIATSDLVNWNSWLGSDCDTNLYANLNSSDSRSVCVGINGTTASGSSSSLLSTTSTDPGIQTMSSTTSTDAGIQTASISSTTSTFSTTTSSDPGVQTTPATTSTTIMPSSTTPTMGPTQSGEVSGCQQHYTVQSGDSCAAIDSTYGISFQQFYSCNPSVGDNCQYLVIGNAYCVVGPPSTTTNAVTSTGPTMGPTQSGEVAGCRQHYTVQSGDSCAAIDSTYGITSQQFYNWNPAVGSDCQYLVIGNAYCVQGP